MIRLDMVYSNIIFLSIYYFGTVIAEKFSCYFIVSYTKFTEKKTYIAYTNLLTIF